MSNEKQKQTTKPQAENHAQNARVSSVAPAHQTDLPHNVKKESLGPNTKR